ncbi:Cytochrome c oxidase subunit III [Sulfobacillus thermosulfidooxidans DSM 9293]|uniref:Cytochrome c oxidase subunit III n=1 Tax=Sulfobacillus thermosulfidooxidans (strain DSM 9293 / VKM B-1269 / AT-1) TaxID=929705 RepID=A0A1W1W848_SULTA|nr:cytochrome c oxidase subunit 3 [Sulfobacillus thermosulfidooxidans]SMC02230.1 Cytochrome c oxidase subunit III [Sulfobacillus thermosulfidooxidans DSM 9293]
MVNKPEMPVERRSEAITPHNYRAVRFSMLVFIATQIVPFVVLFEAKYLYDGTYVAPQANQGFGVVVAALMAVSALVAWQAVKAGRHLQDRDRVGSRLKIAAGLGLLALLGLVYQWGMRYVSPQSRFGEMYYVILGADLVYAVIGLIMLGISILRNVRQNMAPERFWTAEASVYFWIYVALAWIASWLAVYII